ncbi:Petrobactin import system permease protein YclO [Rhodovastum atsumiense]|uniref:Iron chelate uptake ABC transporter family permease subunit n=1 Tax=Rhodovastum atsumiense TaxID=504468 RepID=A0A5M6IRN5_9PROT|nr:iron chelate uptake ABC transporter family permease subunit [Rhodovastum atsumiense]KAA5610942.1 iron chelate uptake ABC transporter family permease subunit [Rhodovastum atsumiense]CAH2601484.1 Petrobactin import system permease protein YclO [Rhodovastum atsumiense]
MQRRCLRVLALLAVLTLLAIAAFMTVGARGDWGFVLAFRGAKVLALLLVGGAVGVATVLFQTVTGNRILTPSVMGFDALFVLVQTTTIHLAGNIGTLPREAGFVLQATLMVALSALLYGRMFRGEAHGLHIMVLAGIGLGTLFRALTALLQRMLDPAAFAVLQGRLFADFNRAELDLLAVAALAMAATGVMALRDLHRFDVIALGREPAIGLGVEYRPAVRRMLGMVAVLVAVPTALVGPIGFLGLLVANLAYRIMPSSRHAVVLPAAALLGMLALLLGQLVLERVLGLGAALSIVIEFAGGVLFLLLLLRGARG